jgi:CheY-like chemotaxis protein
MATTKFDKSDNAVDSSAKMPVEGQQSQSLQRAEGFRIAELAINALTPMIWPVVVLFAVLYFGGEIKSIIERSDRQTFKFGEAEISLETTRATAAQFLGAATVSRQNQLNSKNTETEVPTIAPHLNASQTASVVNQALTIPNLAQYSGKKLLWVDDRPDNNKYVSQLFRSLYMIIDTSTSTDEALTKLAKSEYAVVITDMRRGYDDTAGYELLNAMRKQNINTPVVIYSASSNPRFQEQAKKRGAFGETNDPTELLSLVTQAILSKQGS